LVIILCDYCDILDGLSDLPKASGYRLTARTVLFASGAAQHIVTTIHDGWPLADHAGVCGYRG